MERDIAEFASVPDRDLLGDPREVDADLRRDERELGDLVARGDGVDRIRLDRLEAELDRDGLGV